MVEVTMPRLSDTMEEGTVSRWIKQPGDRVAVGDIIAEIETDKANMDLEAFDAGTLLQILVPEGETVPIGRPIAILGEGEAKETAPRAPAASIPTATPTPSGNGGAPAAPPPSSPAPALAAAPAPSTASTPSDTDGDGVRIRASPLARQIAQEHGIDLRGVSGTGPAGRITRRNVQQAIERRAAGTATAAPAATAPAAPATVSSAPAAASAEAPAPSVGEGTAAPARPAPTVAQSPTPPAPAGAVVPLSRGRRAVARTMTASKPGVPHLYAASEIDMAAALALRREINADRAAEERISVNDLIVRAAALALRALPALNCSYATTADGQDAVVQHEQVNISVAVALDDGLVAPVVRDADKKSVGTIAAEARDLAARARAGRLRQPELEGGTFTVSNLGMFDVFAFVSVITPPQAASLAVGSVRRIPVVQEDGSLGAGEQMLVVISADHRVTDGATAARWLEELKRLLQTPMRLLV